MSDGASIPRKLHVSHLLRAQLLDWARAAVPDEACGLLLGQIRGERVEVEHVRRARNVAADARQAFEVHPEDHLALALEAERLGLDVVGAWHSHPRGPARPSDADRTGAWDGWMHAIVGRDAQGEFEVRVWRAHGEAWTEIARATAANERGARESGDRDAQ